MPSLLLDEARARSDLLTVTADDVTLDLCGDETFTSRTVIDVVSRGGETFLGTDELFTTTRQFFEELSRLFGTRIRRHR